MCIQAHRAAESAESRGIYPPKASPTLQVLAHFINKSDDKSEGFLN